MAALLMAAPAAGAEGDPAKGEKVFKKCAACHAVGEGAKNRIGPHLNDVIGRAAGSLDGFAFSDAMVDAGQQGMVWSAETLATFLEAPRKAIKGTKMTFVGLNKEADRADVIAYLASRGEPAVASAKAAAPASDVMGDASSGEAVRTALAKDVAVPAHGVFHLGRVAAAEEIAAWDIDIRPDGQGLPPGGGTVADGEVVFTEQCAACHGDFGEGRDRWPVLAGGFDTLKAARPEKTIGSYWPYLSTVYDYVRRAMPFGNARSLTDDEVYALTAYLLYLNDIVTDEDFELSHDNFASVRLPNEANFIDDDRAAEPHYAAKAEPCMRDCKPDARILNRARVLDVTPDVEDGSGQIE